VKDFPFDLVFQSIRLCINANLSDHRVAAMGAVTTIYKVFGFQKVEPLFALNQGFNQKILQMLKPDIPEVSAYIK
jgi:hypothetical protein